MFACGAHLSALPVIPAAASWLSGTDEAGGGGSAQSSPDTGGHSRGGGFPQNKGLSAHSFQPSENQTVAVPGLGSNSICFGFKYFSVLDPKNTQMHQARSIEHRKVF